MDVKLYTLCRRCLQEYELGPLASPSTTLVFVLCPHCKATKYLGLRVVELPAKSTVTDLPGKLYYHNLTKEYRKK